MRAVPVIVLVAACKSSSAPPAPAPSKPAEAAKPKAADPWNPVEAPAPIHDDVVSEGFVVVVPKGGNINAAIADAQARTAKLGGLVDVRSMTTLQDSEREMMRYINPSLTAADLDGIGAGAGVAIAIKGEPNATLRAISAASLEVATAAHGWVLDPRAGAAYTAAQFAKHVPGDVLDVRTQIYVHDVSNEGGLPFLDTMGMGKLGFPELMVSAAAGVQMKELTILVDATAQTLVAHPEIVVPGTIEVDLAALPGDWQIDAIRKRGGSGHARWLASWNSENDSDERMIELVPATGSGTEGVEQLIDACFGTQPDTVIGAKAGDPELAAVAERARNELLAMRSHFAKGVPFKEQLLVKAPFTEQQQTEWMWIEVVTWKGDTFAGTLVNQPDHLKSVREGSQVTVPFAKVSDYLLTRADGTRTGGYSDAILLKREGSR